MAKSPLILMFLGKSGCGKGTQVNLLVEKYGLEKIGSGELLRERKKSTDFTGEKISSVVDNGGIVPTPVIFSLWMEKLDNYKHSKADIKGIIFDGSPRKILEARLMDEALGWYEWNKNIKVILLDISDEEAVKRIELRKICPKCRAIISNAEELDGEIETCTNCGHKLEKRPEDVKEGVLKRLEWFQTEVGPVIEYYKEQNRLITINGEQSVAEVFEDIVKVIGEI